MIKKSLMILVFLVLVMQAVSATTTDINLKVPSFTEVHLTVLNPDVGGFSALAGPYKKTSDYYGDVQFNYSGTATSFDLMVVLKQKGIVISSQKYRENYPAGSPVYLEIIPEGYSLIETPNSTISTISTTTNSTNSTDTNSTTANSTSESNETLNSTGDQTGNVVKGFSLSLHLSDHKGLKTTLYIIGAIILLGGLVMFTSRFVQIKAPSRKIKVRKLSEVKAEKEEKAKSVESDKEDSDSPLKSVEEKLRKAQEELNNLKKEQKVKEIEERLKKDKEELERLSRR